MAFHPRYWTQPVKNGSREYNCQETAGFNNQSGVVYGVTNVEQSSGDLRHRQAKRFAAALWNWHFADLHAMRPK